MSKQYSPKQINEIKQQIRTGKPAAIIAEELSKEWNRPLSGLYTKVWALSKQTRKINNEYKGPVRRKYSSRKRKLRSAIIDQEFDFNPMPGSVLEKVIEIVQDIKPDEAKPVVKEICQEIVNKPLEMKSIDMGIELPAGVIQFTGTPTKTVIYSDHVRYYFNN